MIDLIGYVAFLTNVLGNLLLTRKNIAGWPVRIVSIVCWAVYGVSAESGPILVNAVTFLRINLYGWWNWRNLASRTEDS